MSLNNPSDRPWGTARGAHIVVTTLWGLIALIALATAAFWVRSLRGDEGALVLALTGFNISIFAAIGVLFADINTTERRQVEEGTALARFPGAWFIGAGTGALVACVLGDGDPIVAFWGSVMLVIGIAAYFSPQLLANSRARRARNDSHIRSTGASATATVTEVRTGVRNHRIIYRPTLTFTDREGRQRWFTRTAPVSIHSVTKGQSFGLHYDAEHPGRRRSLVVSWGTGERS